ncbi:hypothetical protein OXT66_05725 [Lentilactobacillus senioris]|uniref:hypothetical protein n=1 Tax=Lentilactobacillus senioris TaxID=931534 RepID=UPI0022814751|nr:hypothetical protein [Lentilactobacillus senioris]MCY9807049.1 hypothetical protein [Lentilactobacillus senioris]
MKKRFKDFLLDSKFFYAVLGFVLGAIIPTWFLINDNPDAFGDLGEWASAIGTLMAVIVSLYLATNKKGKLKVFRWAKGDEKHMTIVNAGTAPITFLPFVKVIQKEKSDNSETESDNSKLNDGYTVADKDNNYVTWITLQVGESYDVHVLSSNFNKQLSNKNYEIKIRDSDNKLTNL